MGAARGCQLFVTECVAHLRLVGEVREQVEVLHSRQIISQSERWSNGRSTLMLFFVVGNPDEDCPCKFMKMLS